MDHDQDDDRLRRALQGEGPLADDGFTDRVLARLPPPRGAALRGPVLAVSLALALAVLWLAPAAPWLGRTLARFGTSGSLPLSTAVVALALAAATLGATAYAVRPS
jgi:hypothetical protein